MTVKITNDSPKETTLVLEPWGDLRQIAPGESKIVRRTGGSGESLEITLSENEIKIWEEGSGELDFHPSEREA